MRYRWHRDGGSCAIFSTEEVDRMTETLYDSKADTLEHIREVNKNLLNFSMLLIDRAIVHDSSKLGPIEKPHFDRETQKLKSLVYNSDEYKESLNRLKVALDHHYAVNDHHPEHFSAGVNGMNLMQIVEMFCDWAAAAKRNAGGTLNLESSFERFKFDGVNLADIFRNTASTLNIPTVEHK